MGAKEEKSNLEEKVLYVNRCSKVVKGGRKFSFSALILVGDSNGNVGYGFAKANELTDAIKKGGEAARKNLVTFEMEGTSIPHEIFVNFDGAMLLLKPAPAGTGVVAGSKVRSVLEFAGIKDVVAKSLGSNNPINQVKAAFKALAQLRNRKQTLAMKDYKMLTLDNLKNTTRPAKKRKLLGRGVGCKKGKTCGRGHKGAGARSGYKRRYGTVGGGVTLHKRVPTRGFSNADFKRSFDVINLDEIEKIFKEGETVSLESLREKGYLKGHSHGVKVLADGTLKKKVKFQVEAISAGAKEKLKNAGIAV